MLTKYNVFLGYAQDDWSLHVYFYVCSKNEVFKIKNANLLKGPKIIYVEEILDKHFFTQPIPDLRKMSRIIFAWKALMTFWTYNGHD